MGYLRTLAKCIALLAALSLATGAWCSQGKGKGSQKGKGDRQARSEARVDVGVRIFTGQDRDLIQEYVAGLPSVNLPPGLAKRGGSLPPGLKKHLRKNGRLPRGLQKRVHAFPAKLEQRLPPLAPGLKRGFIEGRAIIYGEKVYVVLDIFIPL